MPSRRRFLAAVTAAGTASVAGCSTRSYDAAASAAGERTDWPTDGHDVANTGYAPNAAPITDPVEAWRAEIVAATGPPVATDGRVYVPAGDSLLVLDADSGDELWRVETEGRGATFWAPPTVSGGVVYLGDGDAQVRAFDAETGDRLWRFETERGVYAAPTFADYQLVFGTSGERVYSLDPETGDERWHRDVFGDVKTRVAVRPPSIVVATTAGEVYSLSLHGEGHWRRRLPDRIDCPPTVVEDTAYVGCNDGKIRALRTDRGGRTDWTASVGGFPKGVAVAHDAVYVGGRHFHALDAESGRKRWHVRADGSVGVPAVAADTVYVGASERLYAYKPGGGVGTLGVRVAPSRWSRKLGDGGVHRVAATDGRVYATLRGSDGSDALVAFEQE